MTELRVACALADMDNEARGLCARLAPGATLEIAADGQGIAVLFDGRRIGRLPESEAWLATHLVEGDAMVCSLTAVQTSGFLRKRATAVNVEIVVMPGGLTLGDLRRALGAGSVMLAQLGSSAMRQAGDLGRSAGSVTFAAARAGEHLAAGTSRAARQTFVGAHEMVVRPMVGAAARGLDGVTEIAVRRPVRAVKRTLMLLYGAVVLILLLVLAIVVVWKLPGAAGLASDVPRQIVPR
jgi:hypothetical protein